MSVKTDMRKAERGSGKLSSLVTVGETRSGSPILHRISLLFLGSLAPTSQPYFKGALNKFKRLFLHLVRITRFQPIISKISLKKSRLIDY